MHDQLPSPARHTEYAETSLHLLRTNRFDTAESSFNKDFPGGSLSSWRHHQARAQATKTANVICMKWGDRYGPEWVNRLYAMVMRNTTWKIRLVCLTDDRAGIRPEVECLSLPQVYYDEQIGIYWPKLGMFDRRLHDLKGMTLYLDLDLIILENIDCFFEFDGRFCIVREWKDAHLALGNSSIVRFFAGFESQILDRFYEATDEEIVRDYGAKEQNFVSRHVEELTFWPTEWCPPFAGACLPRNRIVRFFSTPKQPKNGKILVFFGSITPATALLGQHDPRKRVRTTYSPRLTRQRFRPAPWISELWRE